MNRAIFIGLIFAVMLAVGTVAGALGVTASPIGETVLQEPGETSGFFGLWEIFKWAWTAAVSFFQLMTFQVDIPPLANAFIMFPTSATMAFLLYQAIRGA